MSYRLKHLRKRKKPGMRIIYITKNLFVSHLYTREPLPPAPFT
nr:MAG TPA: hypothetical protein [Bacteriophage sp.]